MAGGLWALVLSAALLPLFGEPEDLVRPVREAARQAPLALAAMPLMLAIAAVPAMAEEVVYRGWLLSVLGLRVGPWAAVTVSSVVFACIHVAPVEWGEPARLASAAAYCAGGMALGAVAMAQGHVWGAAAFHITFNAVMNWMLLADLGFDVQEAWDASNEVGSEELSDALAWLALEAALAAALLRLWWTRRQRA